jgi:hypothetical protein
MCVNDFRGFMNEFPNLTRLEKKPNKAKRKKEKNRKIEDAITYAGHTFLLTIIKIPTACEICTSCCTWPMERGLVCQSKYLRTQKICYVLTHDKGTPLAVLLRSVICFFQKCGESGCLYFIHSCMGYAAFLLI